VAIDVHARAENENRIRKTTTDAANHYARIVGAIIGGQHHIRYVFADLVDPDDAQYLHLLGRHRRNRHRLIQ
jgi:hypothetical protein